MDSRHSGPQAGAGREFLRVQVDAAAGDHAQHALILTGVLEGPTARELLTVMADTLPDPVPELVVVDIAGVRFLGSQGLRCLMACRRHVESRGGRMVLRNPAPMAERILYIAGMLDSFGLSMTAQGTSVPAAYRIETAATAEMVGAADTAEVT
ncbi:STAS domain-containing protein [Dactylosporangium maewongense]|uniref:STAS domain-containing protein n=1 Tax=Dactylosporangium maewongense TaxID=634393 RepID=UPI0031D64DA7